MAKVKRSLPRWNDPRFNLALYNEHLKFCQGMAWKKHQSVTKYINDLIAQEMGKHDRTEWEIAPEESE